MTTVQEWPCEGGKDVNAPADVDGRRFGGQMSGNIYRGLLLGPLGGKKSQRAQVHLPKLKDREQSKERVKRLRWFVIAYQAGVDPLDSLEAKKFEDILLQFFFWRDGSE